MGIRKQKPGSGPIGPGSTQRPVRRDYVEEIQRRADYQNKVIENNGKISDESEIAGQRQRQVQRHMAHLRGEAVQARRLAEQIDYLSQQTTPRKRKQTMTNSSTIDRERTQRQKRRASDKPAGGGKQSKFNPLHPSMELPPEQLIRLLGLEDKKSRKKRKSPAATKPTPSATLRRTKKMEDPHPQAAAIKQPAPKASWAGNEPSQPVRRRQRERVDASVFGEQRRGLLLPTLGFGIVAGIALSVYLFWGQPEPQKTAVKPTETRKPVAASKPAPVVRKSVPAAPASNPADNPKWRAAIRAQEQRLRTAAQQRLDEHKQEASQSVATEANTSTAVATPNTVAETLAPAVEPVPSTSGDSIDQAPVEAPEISVSEPPPLADDEAPLATPTENIQTDGISEAVTPIPPIPPASDGMAPGVVPAEPLPAPATESGYSAETPESLPPADAMSTEPAVADLLTDDGAPDDLAAEPETTSTPTAQPGYSEAPDSAAGNAGASDRSESCGEAWPCGEAW